MIRPLLQGHSSLQIPQKAQTKGADSSEPAPYILEFTPKSEGNPKRHRSAIGFRGHRNN